MAAQAYTAPFSVEEAVRRLCRGCTVLDRSELNLPGGRCVVLELAMRKVFTAHATVTVDDMTGCTRVHVSTEPGLMAGRMDAHLRAALQTDAKTAKK